MKRQLILLLLLLFVVNTQVAQDVSGDLKDNPLQRQIVLADGALHKLEIGSKGVFLDGKLKASAKGQDSQFHTVTPLLESQEYWNTSEDYYENGSNGIWFVFGTVWQQVCVECRLLQSPTLIRKAMYASPPKALQRVWVTGRVRLIFDS